MSVINNNLLLTAPAASATGVSRSLRFNSPDSAYLGPRTFSTPTSSTAWTWAGWIKKTLNTTSTDYRGIFDAGSGSNYAYLDFSDNGVRFANRPTSGTIAVLQTTAVFRDVSAWFHLVFVYDSANGTSTDRLRVYINGNRITAFNTVTYPDSSQASVINSAVAHRIGYDAGNSGYLDAYLADVYFIDGQALDPSSFTTTDATTGQLIPKAFSGGSYGTNGWHLDFADNSAATATTLGKDSAGSNNWTPNNFSVTAGAGNDSLVDVPTNGAQTDTGAGGEVKGNYCVFTPLGNGSSSAPTSGLSNGNLQVSGSITGGFQGSFGIPVGKWYWEVTLETVSTPFVGILNDSRSLTADPGVTLTNEYGFYMNPAINYIDGSGNPWGASSVANGDVIGVAVDASDYANIKLWLSKNNTWYSSGGGTSGNPGAGTNAIQTITANKTLYPFCAIRGATGSSTMQANFGQRPFAYTAPSGFKALCTANLPAPTVVKPSTVMDVVLYTGTGSAQTPTSSLGFSPDLVWLKSRSNATSNKISDTVRGVNNGLVTDTAAAETVDSGVTAFNSNGFTLGTGGNYNTSSATYVAWCWDAGSSSATNNNGSISSTVRANATAGLSVITWTGQASAGTIGHGLGVAPSLIICKARSNAQSWGVYHKDVGINNYLLLDSTGASTAYSGIWGSSAPTSTVFSVPGNVGLNNNSGWTYVAYCFAPVSSYSAFGSYTGNGSSDGPFVACNFAPAFVMIKRTDTAGYSWAISDYQRPGFNQVQRQLFSDQAVAETNDTVRTIDLLSNGFKLRNGTADTNGSAGTFIYAAFALNPFAYARAR